MTTVQQIQSQILGQMKQGQQVARQLADTGTWSGVGASRPAHRGPHSDVLPGPAEFVDQMFDFWVRLLEAQRGFVLNGVNALVPTVPTPGQVVRPTPSRARSITSGTNSGAVVSPAPSPTIAARTADSTADEHISRPAADAIATAAAITAEKTATVKETLAPETRSTAKKVSAAKTPKKTSIAEKTSTPEKTSTAKKTSASKKASAPKKASASKTTSTAKKASTAKQKRS